MRFGQQMILIEKNSIFDGEIPPALSRPFFGGLPSSSVAFLRTVGPAKSRF